MRLTPVQHRLCARVGQRMKGGGAAVMVVTVTHKHALETIHPTIAGYGQLTAALLRR